MEQFIDDLIEYQYAIEDVNSTSASEVKGVVDDFNKMVMEGPEELNDFKGDWTVTFVEESFFKSLKDGASNVGKMIMKAIMAILRFIGRITGIGAQEPTKAEKTDIKDAQQAQVLIINAETNDGAPDDKAIKHFETATGKTLVDEETYVRNPKTGKRSKKGDGSDPGDTGETNANSDGGQSGKKKVKVNQKVVNAGNVTGLYIDVNANVVVDLHYPTSSSGHISGIDKQTITQLQSYLNGYYYTALVGIVQESASYLDATFLMIGNIELWAMGVKNRNIATPHNTQWVDEYAPCEQSNAPNKALCDGKDAKWKSGAISLGTTEGDSSVGDLARADLVPISDELVESYVGDSLDPDRYSDALASLANAIHLVSAFPKLKSKINSTRKQLILAIMRHMKYIEWAIHMDNVRLTSLHKNKHAISLALLNHLK